MTHTMHDEEVNEFNSGFNAYKSGVPVENAPETTHDMWRPGYAFAAFDDLRAEVERLRAEYDSEVSEFNAGFDAYKAGLPLENEPETKHDLWRAGYAFSAFDDLRAEVKRLRAAAGERDALRSLLQEWRNTPFFDTRDEWWVEDFGARVNAAYAVVPAPSPQADDRLAVAEAGAKAMQEWLAEGVPYLIEGDIAQAILRCAIQSVNPVAVARRAVEG